MRRPRLLVRHGTHAGARKPLRPAPRPPLALVVEAPVPSPVGNLDVIKAHQVIRNTPVITNPRDPDLPAWELAVALAELRRAALVLYTAAAFCKDEHHVHPPLTGDDR